LEDFLDESLAFEDTIVSVIGLNIDSLVQGISFKSSIAAIESKALKVTWNSTWMKREAASQNTMAPQKRSLSGSRPAV